DLGIPAEITNRRDIHVLDVPAIGRPFDRIERRLTGEVSLSELDADIPTASHSGRLANDTRAVVLEVAGKDRQALLELGPIHRFASRAILRAPLGGHRLEIAGICGPQELFGRD